MPSSTFDFLSCLSVPWETLPSENWCASHGLSVGDLAAAYLRPGLTFDYALPQPVVDSWAADGTDLRGQAVWAYPRESVCGILVPLTIELAAKMQITLLIGEARHASV